MAGCELAMRAKKLTFRANAVKLNAVKLGLANRAAWPIVDGLRALGFDAAAILRAAGLSEEALREPEGRLDHCVAMRLWAEAVKTTGDANLGMHVAEAAPWESFDVHTYLMRASATLREAYALMCRYQRLIHDQTRVELLREGAVARLRHTVAGGGAAPRQPAEFLAALWLRIGRHVTGVAWRPLEVRFAHAAPASAREHARLFGGPVRFAAAENALVFAEELLALPCVTAEPGLLAVLSRHADSLLAARPEAESLSGRVAHMVVEELSNGAPPAGRIARRLGMSVRTMQRRLAEEGTPYGEITDRVRCEMAARYLGDTRLSIAQIAALAGYAETSAFIRAFKRRRGLSPSAYRREPFPWT